jgi:glycosyltransferase involved in cell wall biosynthesis
MDAKISVVLPAYNEAEHIVSNLLETVDTLAKFEYDFEVIVVDDGSPDQTYLHAARLLVSHPERVRVVHYEENRGKGNALMTGSWFARGDYVVFLDADMDLHPVQVPTLLGIAQASEADIVVGSKLHPLSNVNYPKKRRLYSLGYYALIRLLFGLPVKDTQTGLKVFRREVLQRVFPRILAKRFAFDIEVLANAHRLGYRIESAPVTLEFRRSFGRINWRDAAMMLRDTLAIFYRMHILRYYDRLEDQRLEHLPITEWAREVLAEAK